MSEWKDVIYSLHYIKKFVPLKDSMAYFTYPLPRRDFGYWVLWLWGNSRI